MIPLSSVISDGLTWSRVSRNRSCELKRNDEVVGRLRHPGFFSSSFLAETEDGQWTFRRIGLLGAGAEILDSVSQQRIATFKTERGGGGVLTFADGETFRLGCKGCFRPVWSLMNENGQPVLRLHVREKTVEVPTDAAIPQRRLCLLIMFAWYRILQAEEDAASAAMVAC